MKRVCFVCLGNICRSTMAEFLFGKLVVDKGIHDHFYIQSRGTSNEAVGWGVYDGTARVLDRLGIDYSKKVSTQLVKSDGEKYDFFICMDDANVANAKRILGKECNAVVCKLLEFCGEDRAVLDPYYTRDFEATYRDVAFGLDGFLEGLGY